MTTTHDTLRAVAGDFYDELGARIGTDGINHLVRVLDELDERYDDGEPGATTEHWNGTLMLAYGDASLAELAEARRQAHMAYLDTHARLLGAIVHAARIDGMTEAQITRESGLSRMTVRKALGRGGRG